MFFVYSTSETAALLQNKPVIYPDTFFKLTPRYHENQKQGDYLKSFHQRIIDERREILKNNNNELDSKEGYNIFIDHILHNEGMFSDADIQDHVITVLSAGNYRLSLVKAGKVVPLKTTLIVMLCQFEILCEFSGALMSVDRVWICQKVVK